MVRLGGYITSLQLRNTIQSDSLERATQLLGQLSFNVGTNIPGDWEPFVRFNLQSGYIRVLLIKQEERQMAVSTADTHAQTSNNLWQPVPPRTTRVHAHVFADSGFNLTVEPLDLAVCPRIPSRCLADCNSSASAHGSKGPLKFLPGVYADPPRFTVLRKEIAVKPVCNLVRGLGTQRVHHSPLGEAVDAHQ